MSPYCVTISCYVNVCMIISMIHSTRICIGGHFCSMRLLYPTFFPLSRALSLTRTNTDTHSLSPFLSHKNAHTYTNAYAHAQRHPHAHAHTCTHTHKYTHTNTHTHTRIHTHTHTQVVSCTVCSMKNSCLYAKPGNGPMRIFSPNPPLSVFSQERDIYWLCFRVLNIHTCKNECK